MRQSVENLLRECLARLPTTTREQLASIEKELLDSAAEIDRTKPADSKTALYELIVQQTSNRENAAEFLELQTVVAQHFGRRRSK